MPVRVAINGFGRIGRLALRAVYESGRRDVEIVAVNDLAPVATHAHLLRYDSSHGPFPGGGPRLQERPRHRRGPGRRARRARPGGAALGPTRHRHRLRMHGAVRRSRQGRGASGGGSQAGAGLGAGRGRRSHRGLWREREEAAQAPPRGLERVVHDQLSGAGRLGARQAGGRRPGLHDHRPRLHRRPAHRGHAAWRPAARPLGRGPR